MANRAHQGPRAGWRSVFDPGLWRQGLVAATAGAVSMALLACTVALVRDTTGHDWYAAYKITVADVTIGVGFDEDAPVEYRNADGEVESVSRFRLTHSLEARWAREGILEAAWNGATLGALSGFGGALLCLALVWRSMEDRRGRRPANEPAPDRRGEALDRSTSPPASPAPAPAPARNGSAPPPLRATATATDARANRLPASGPRQPGKPEPTATRQDKAAAGKETTKPPAAGPAPRRKRRRAGRWI